MIWGYFRFNECFGSKFAFLDSLLGSDENFHGSVYNKRHRILLGFKSINETYPDSKVKQKKKQYKAT